MRDMMAKYGTRVESFRYAFVLAAHAPGWDLPDQAPAQASGKPPTYIVIGPSRPSALPPPSRSAPG